ncbi:MAG: extracellular solute-binding protein [Cellvibrionaceae bacterium]
MRKITLATLSTLLLISSPHSFSNNSAKLQEIKPPAPLAEPKQRIMKSHAIAMHGEPKYSANFKRFEYTSADAKKGGMMRFFGTGTFDSLNEYIAKGNAAEHLGLIYDSLTVQSLDEPFTKYGLLAHTVEYPEDRSWIIFHMRPEAYFHDKQAITAEDVVFSFNLLMEKGNPAYKFFYGDVEKVESLGPHKVKFSFKTNENRELVLSVGDLPVFPKHFWVDKEFDQSSLEVPLGSGPYKIEDIDAGRNITYARVNNYWAKDLAVNQGFYNFDRISIDYYRDQNVAVEALKAGEYDYRWENSSKFWATAYDIPAVNNGHLIQKEIPHKANSGIQAFIFNLRKPIFQDIELRKAMSYAFDFEWSNKALFYGAYQRSYSFFTNSEFAATGLPDEKELALLLPYKEQLPDTIFNNVYTPHKTDGSGRNRPSLRIAKKILDDAGYKVVKNQLYNANKQPIKFEIMLASPGFERIVNPFIKSLKKLGIIANIRLVDTSQYINRTRNFDFDMRVYVFRQSESPGNEQLNFWGSEAASMQGSSNIIGVKNPVVDQLINGIINSKERDDLVVATRALDRVLLHHHYVIPQWYKPSNRIAHWNKFGIPDTVPIYDRYYRTGVFTWWYDQEKANKIKSKQEK